MFQQRYHQDNQFSLKVRCLNALAFLPEEEVPDAFEELIDDDDFPQELVDYFAKTYIGPTRGRGANRRRLEPMFAIAEWNVMEHTLQNMPRTNNNVEGFHSAL